MTHRYLGILSLFLFYAGLWLSFVDWWGDKGTELIVAWVLLIGLFPLSFLLAIISIGIFIKRKHSDLIKISIFQEINFWCAISAIVVEVASVFVGIMTWTEKVHSSFWAGTVYPIIHFGIPVIIFVLVFSFKVATILLTRKYGQNN